MGATHLLAHGCVAANLNIGELVMLVSSDFGVDDNNKQNQYNFMLSVLEITFSSPSLQISTVSVNLWWIKDKIQKF